MGNDDSRREITIRIDALDAVPDELKSRDQWVCWAYIMRGGKRTKPPLNPFTGGQASSTDPSTWASFGKAAEAFKDGLGNGIGVVVCADDPYTGIDLDKCIDPASGEIKPEAMEIVRAIDSYAEKTPSKSGLRVLVKGKLPPGGRKRSDVEMYDCGRYFTVTGDHLEGTPPTIENRQAELEQLHADVFGKGEEAQTGDQDPQTLSVWGHDEVIEKAKGATNGKKFKQLMNGEWEGKYTSWSEADIALCMMLAFWTGKDPALMDECFRRSGLFRPKWDERHYGDGSTYGQGTIKRAIENTTEVYEPTTHRSIQMYGDEPDSQEPSQEEEVAGIREALDGIPPESDKADLPLRLEPILRRLAHLGEASAEAFLGHDFKIRFSLKREDVDAYRKIVGRYRREHLASCEEHQFEPSIRITASFEGLVDLVEHDGRTLFLYKEGNQLQLAAEVERNGEILTPPPPEQIPWLMPAGQEVLKYWNETSRLGSGEADRALFDDLVDYFKSISELPGDTYYELLAIWVMHTYLLEDVQYTPIVCLFAVPERGKSRSGKAMIHVAYRGIHVESLREAYIFRVAELFCVSLFIDVMDVWGKAERNNSEDLLLHRFEKGARVPRVNHPDKEPFEQIDYYSIFGPTVVSTNKPVHAILDTRAVTISMPETTGTFDKDVRPEDALHLRTSLFTFRARHLGEPMPYAPKPAKSRLGDILRPLRQVIRFVAPDREPAFLTLVKELEHRRLLEKSDSIEALVLQVILGLESEVSNNLLPLKLVTEAVNRDRPEKNKLSPQFIGQRTKAMGFDKGKTGNGSSALVWDVDKIDRMRRTYGLEETSETEERPAYLDMFDEEPEVTDVTDDSHADADETSTQIKELLRRFNKEPEVSDDTDDCFEGVEEGPEQNQDEPGSAGD